MPLERNQQVDDLFHSALGREPSARPAYLGEACGGDEGLRHEVESLLAAYDEAGSLMDQPVVGAAAQLLAGHHTRSLIGQQIGHYRITALLGTGGMGEVYLAEDTSLGRRVALKLLPALFTTDKERVRRFQREAHAVSSLNHPNILTIHEIGEIDAAHFIATEFIDGVTLRERMAGAPMKVTEALDVAAQVASALAAAHEEGIVHRDIKPENIMLRRRDRIVKVLDFGLAKLTEPKVPVTDPEAALMPKLTTHPGMVIGTVAYMSPEQARGLDVDARTDIWSLGCVLYEMLCGKRAFGGDSAAETLSAILKDDPPDLSTVNTQVSAGLERVVRHCLEKNPEQRFQSARDLAFALQALSVSSAPGQGVATPSLTPVRTKLRDLLPWLIAAALLSTLAVVAVVYSRRAATEVRALRFSVRMPPNVIVEGRVAISPDGRRLAINATAPDGRNMLYVRPLDLADAQPLAGTEGALRPFWSPDSRFIAFFADGKLKKIEASGGRPQVLCDAPRDRGGTWNRAGRIVFAPDHAGALYQVSADGGEVTPATALDESRKERSHRWPYFLPDGRHFLYLSSSETSSIDKPDQSQVFVGSLDSTEVKPIPSLTHRSMMAYAAPGYLLYIRGGGLVAQPFDADRLEVRGEPVPIAKEITYMASTGSSSFSVSDNGVLAWNNRLPDRQLIWIARDGRQITTLGPPSPAGEIFGDSPSLSPDGKQLAVSGHAPQTPTQDLWLVDPVRGTRSRLTTNSGQDMDPVWSPDGRHIAFSSQQGSVRAIYQKLAAGGEEQLLLKAGEISYVQDWSADGRFILYCTLNQRTRYDLWALPLSGERKPFPLLNTEFAEYHAKLSPDGRFLAYASNESGIGEIYVRPFPAPGRTWRVSTGGGTQPRWRRDGKELFYVSGDKKLVAVDVKAGADEFEAGAPRALFQTRIAFLNTSVTEYDVSADGQRFIIYARVEEAAAPVTVLVNWTADLKR